MLLTPTPDEPITHWLLRGLYVKILGELSNQQSYYSRDIAEYLGIPQAVLKPIMRELRLYGLVQYNHGGINDDCLMYGSGHFVTAIGREYYQKMRVEYDHINTRPTES